MKWLEEVFFQWKKLYVYAKLLVHISLSENSKNFFIEKGKQGKQSKQLFWRPLLSLKNSKNRFFLKWYTPAKITVYSVYLFTLCKHFGTLPSPEFLPHWGEFSPSFSENFPSPIGQSHTDGADGTDFALHHTAFLRFFELSLHTCKKQLLKEYFFFSSETRRFCHYEPWRRICKCQSFNVLHAFCHPG